MKLKTKHTSSRIFKNKSILITGGTGSFGNSVVSELLQLQPQEIVIFSRDEKKQFDMRTKYNDSRLRFVIGDVRDRDSVLRIFEDVNIDYVFHAAALKQVPSCEFFPMEAVKTNIVGAHHVIHASIRHNVKKLVILSTDKAAYPINAMGMTKALMEKVMIANSRDIDNHAERKTILCGVRYGNVMYSRGSVIPFFISCMRKNEPLPITDYHMTRFMLPLPKAVDLVLFALVKGKNGYMYIRKAPACTIETLAKAMCELFSYKKGYKQVGIRAGEKLHETLATKEELMRSNDLQDYYEIRPDSRGLDYDRYYDKGLDRVKPDKSFTSANTTQLTQKGTVRLLRSLPEIRLALKNQNEQK